MHTSDEAAIHAALEAWVEPASGKTLAQLQAIQKVTVDTDTVSIVLQLGIPAARYQNVLQQQLAEHLQRKIVLEVQSKLLARQVQTGLKPLAGVKNIIAIASGKGGVGKSTTAANLALALADEGAAVGVLDADIYGPSQPRMFGVSGRPQSPDGKTVLPMENYGVRVMSIGLLIDEDTPMVWRGPMATGALEQLLRDTQWGELDYLIIDLPPGTGDIQLTLSQKIPVSGAVIVTTPQDIALLDARKGLKMFEKVKVPILGVVENMSTHICSQCGHEEHIFGSGGGAQMCRDYDVDFLGSLPLDLQIRQQADGGHPTVAADPDSALAQHYRDIALATAARLASQSRDYAGKFPKIVVQNT